MSQQPTIYLITNLALNHNPNNIQPLRRLPIDSRFDHPQHRYVLYLTDDTPAPTGMRYCKTIMEAELDPLLHKAGKEHLAEWSFLLAEEKHAFCSYPFFMISSRFYVKNAWLKSDLNAEWDRLFSYFTEYDHAFLPSYSRPLRWLPFGSLMKNPRVFFPFTQKFPQLMEEIFQTKFPEDYPRAPDLPCHYIGFKNREALLDYVKFYKPILDFFFSDGFVLKRPIEDYIVRSGHFPNEKPLTFLFEMMSHLYFAKMNKKFFCLHYDGYYEIDFAKPGLHRLEKFHIPFITQIKRMLSFYLFWLSTEASDTRMIRLLTKTLRWCKKRFPVLAKIQS